LDLATSSPESRRTKTTRQKGSPGLLDLATEIGVGETINYVG
jgi:hypothetical protein